MADPDLCIHCRAYWRAGHTETCPQVTKVWPVTEAEADIVCGEDGGNLGDFYTVVDGVIVCLGCAAAELLCIAPVLRTESNFPLADL